MLNNKKSFKVSISDLLILILLIYPLIIFFLISVNDNNTLVNYFSLVLMSLLSILMALFLYYANKYLSKVLPIVIIFYILNIIWFFTRFASLIFDPNTFDGGHVSPQSNDLTLAVLYFFIINIIFMTAIFFSENIYNLKPLIFQPVNHGIIKHRKYINIFFVILIFYAISNVLSFYSGLTGSSPAMLKGGILINTFKTLISFHAIYLLILLWGMSSLFNEKITNRKKYYLYLILFFTALIVFGSSTLSGSKQGFYYFLMASLVITVIYRKYHRYKITLSKIIILFSILILTLTAFNTGRHIRHLRLDSGILDMTETFDELRFGDKISKNGKAPQIFVRLSGFDSLMDIFNKYDQIKLRPTLYNDLKMVINFILPGTYFNDGILSAQYYGVLFANESKLRYVNRDIYITYMFTYYGYMITYFGLIGSMLMSFFLFLFGGIFYQIIRKNIYLSFIFLTVFTNIIHWFGFDLILIDLFQIIIPFIFTFIILFFVETIKNSFKNLNVSSDNNNVIY